MARIEGIRIKNFRTLKDIEFGKYQFDWDTAPLTRLTAIIGKNGSGKSSLIDAFGFIADCLEHDVEYACEQNYRGGFLHLCSHGQEEPIEFQIYYRENEDSRPITYNFKIALDKKNGRPIVISEQLQQRRKKQTRGSPYNFLKIDNGIGYAWKGDSLGRIDNNHDLSNDSDEDSGERVPIELTNKSELAIKSLAGLKDHPRIEKFRNFLRGWHLSYFQPDAARSSPISSPQKHLSVHGENLANVVQYFERGHPERFKRILDKIARKIPGIERIETKKIPELNNGVVLCFYEKSFKEPFYAAQMSDGTLKLFAYLLMMEETEAHPLICIEEPENGLYPELMEDLAQNFRDATERPGRTNPQIIITTHQPLFLDALKPEEIWILKKGEDGFSKLIHASDIDLVRNFYEEKISMGSQWISHYLDDV